MQPNGAGKWRDEYANYLAGANVVILPDEDSAGELHQAKVEKSLEGVAARVRVLKLGGIPGGGDVYDWLKAGGTKKGLAEAVKLADEAVGSDKARLEAAPHLGDGKEQPKARGWRDHVFTAEALRNKTFLPTSFIVPDTLPEELAILSGKPKVGKSFMAMDFCIGVTADTPIFGSLKPLTGDAIYAANEDTDRRLKGRMAKYLSPFSPWPDRLTLTTSSSRLDVDGVSDLRDWASSVQQPRLAVIDTLATVRPTRRNNETPYDADYRALAELHDFVGTIPGFAVLVLQHNRKADSDDPIDLISGTLGGPGVADTLLVLNKTTQGPTLHVRGRDVEETDFAVRFNKQTCRWSLIGNADAVHMSETRKKILDALFNCKAGRMTPAEVVAATGLAKNVVDSRLADMVNDGQVVKLGRGTYAHPDKVPMGPIYSPCVS